MTTIIDPLDGILIPVTFCGLQESFKHPLVLVNEPSGSTVVFDPTKHQMHSDELLKLGKAFAFWKQDHK